MPNLTNVTANLTGNQTSTNPTRHLFYALKGLHQFISGINDFLTEVLPLLLSKAGITLPKEAVWLIVQFIIWGPTVYFLFKKVTGRARKLGLFIVFILAGLFIADFLGFDVIGLLAGLVGA